MAPYYPDKYIPYSPAEVFYADISSRSILMSEEMTTRLRSVYLLTE